MRHYNLVAAATLDKSLILDSSCAVFFYRTLKSEFIELAALYTIKQLYLIMITTHFKCRYLSCHTLSISFLFMTDDQCGEWADWAQPSEVAGKEILCRYRTSPNQVLIDCETYEEYKIFDHELGKKIKNCIVCNCRCGFILPSIKIISNCV